MPATDVELYRKLYTFDVEEHLSRWELPRSRPAKKSLKLPRIKRPGQKRAVSEEEAQKENTREVDIDRVIRKLFEKKQRWG